MISYNKNVRTIWGHDGKINPTRNKKTKKPDPDQVFRQRLIPALRSIGYDCYSPDSTLERLFGQPQPMTYTEEFLMVRIKTNDDVKVEFSLNDFELEARWRGYLSKLKLDENFEDSLKLLIKKIKMSGSKERTSKDLQ